MHPNQEPADLGLPDLLTEKAFQEAVARFIRSALIDYLAITLRRPPTAQEARDMASDAQRLLLEAQDRGWEAL